MIIKFSTKTEKYPIVDNFITFFLLILLKFVGKPTDFLQLFHDDSAKIFSTRFFQLFPQSFPQSYPQLLFYHRRNRTFVSLDADDEGFG